MTKTNKGLVNYAKAQLGLPYWYGCFGQYSTKALYYSKRKQYPSQYTWSCPESQLNKKVHDCVGLIKGYLWSETPTSKPKYNSKQDVSANGMYEFGCDKKGKISSMPDVAGVLVFMDGHVGVYIGNGYVIEARGHKYGVVKTKLSERGWRRWGMCKWIDYIKEEKPTEPPEDVKKEFYPRYKGLSVSIVDALMSLGIDSSFKHRNKIAKANGIKNYKGTPTQNIKMLKLLRKGKLIKA